MKQFISKGYFEQFNSENFFYLFDFKSRGVLFFSERFFNDSFGIQIFFDDSGLNYLHDALTSKNGFSINHFFSNAVLLAVVQKADLLEDDIDFLHQQKLKAVETNYIPYRFKEGYGLDYLSLKELDQVLNYLYYLSSLLENEKNDIIDAFDAEKIVLSFFNPNDLIYEVRYVGMLNLEKFPAKSKKNQSFIDDNCMLGFSNDTCSLCHAYLPIKKTAKASYPSILMLYSEEKKSYEYQLISCNPSRICDYVYGFLDDYFKKNGLPGTLKINHRKIFSSVYKTLTELNMDVFFERENDACDECMYELIEKLIDEPAKEIMKTYQYIS